MTDDAAVASAILTLTASRGADASICPSEAARQVAGEARWQVLLPAVRRVAVALAKEGRIEITRKGRAVDPDAFKGVYRLRVKPDGA